VIDEVGRETGPPEAGARSVAIEHAVPSAERRVVVFGVALALVTLHLVDVRATRSGWASPLRAVDVVLGAALVLVASRLFLHAGRGLRATLALGAGTPAVIAGLGITGAHIWKLGARDFDLSGVASLVAGMVLLGIGIWTLLRGVRGWRRLLALPVAVISVYYVFAPLVIAAFLTHVPPSMLGGRTPADHGLPYRDVTLTTSDSVSLAAWYVPSSNGAAMVVTHGSSSSRLNILDHVGVFGRAGYGVLAFDARGHGRSGGAAMDFGWESDTDIEAAVSFLARQPDVEPGRIGVFGISMSATGALSAAASDDRIAAVIAEGAAISSFDDALTLGSWWTLPFYWMVTAGSDLMSPSEPSIGLEEAMTRVGERPVLLIAGRGKGELILNRRYAAAGSDRTELLELRDTKHSLGIWERPRIWRSRVLGFLDRALAG
jgi:pimeloyl-ACP methyl ester carboxylesterase